MMLLVMEMQLRTNRLKCQLTQKEAAELLNVSFKTYCRYELEEKYSTKLQYIKMCEILEEYGKIDETHGILDKEKIKDSVSEIMSRYDISFCYLFGSYAKGKATETSDVDLLIDTDITGLKYYGLVQELVDTLNKKVDLIKLSDAVQNTALVSEIFRYGERIYNKQ